jgi:hypothetical protein
MSKAKNLASRAFFLIMQETQFCDNALAAPGAKLPLMIDVMQETKAESIGYWFSRA